jgi:enoyl-CoA hydratase
MFHHEHRGRIGVLRLDDGRVNAMSPEWVAGFPQAFREATHDADGHPRPVVVLGTPKTLSAGLDLKRLPLDSNEKLVEFTRGFMRAFAELLSHPRPVVVGVDGAAIAGGTVLALAGDMRVGTPRARMGVPEVPVGIPFPGPVLELVRARIAPPECNEAILRGTIREGKDCLGLGWVDKMVDANALRDACLALAEELGASSPLAFRMAKEQLNRDLVRSFQQFEKTGAEAWAGLLTQPDTKRALEATLAKLSRR